MFMFLSSHSDSQLPIEAVLCHFYAAVHQNEREPTIVFRINSPIPGNWNSESRNAKAVRRKSSPISSLDEALPMTASGSEISLITHPNPQRPNEERNIFAQLSRFYNSPIVIF
jgi:hypothetical protein